MFMYFSKRNAILRMPLIEELKKEEENPIYITDNEFQRILDLSWLDEFYKNTFYFYCSLWVWEWTKKRFQTVFFR